MITDHTADQAAGEIPRPFAFTLGLLRRTPERRILELAGLRPRIGWPHRATENGAQAAVAVWGQSPYARRGEWVAARSGAELWRIEDAFLRSVLPGRSGAPPLGLMIDRMGVHFDPARPSDLETLLATHPLEDPALLDRAHAGMALLRRAHLSKYNVFDPDIPPPEPGYVLVIDQTAGDASVRASGADAATFRTMLATARRDHPGARILVRAHPETRMGLRPGHFTEADLAGAETSAAAISPWALLAGASAVYTVSSQMGLEAILAGQRPVLFGQPFYAGWGLSEDRAGAPARRSRRLTAEQLFAAAYLLFPIWYDPCADRLSSFEEAARQLGAEARAWREDRRGWVATGMRLWKRAPLQTAFGRYRPVRFEEDGTRALNEARESQRPLMVWAGRSTFDLDQGGAIRVEDGLLRSRGLGAELVPPLSLVLDDLGIYYDPSRESRLERLIASDLTAAERARAQALIERIVEAGLSKYNLGGNGLPDHLPAGRRILVPGQVEDDASIRLGAGEIRTNAALIRAARAAHPGALILFKPHPDVEAGLRPGAVPDEALIDVDMVLGRSDPARLLASVDEVFTMTSGMGFEALLRGLPVTCTGQPFYAGWGLTRDLGPEIPRRSALRDATAPDLVALAHAVLIAYPRYTDPASGLPCTVETAVDWLAHGRLPRRSLANRWLAKAQGALAGHAWLWRRG